MLFGELISDVWHVYTQGMKDLVNREWFALTPDEICAKLTGMHRVVTTIRDCDGMDHLEANLVRELIRDCKESVRVRSF